MPARRTHRLLLVAAAWVAVHLAERLHGAAALALGTPLVVGVTVMLPGLAACAAFRVRPRDRLDRAGVAALAGLTVLMAAAAVWAVAGAGFVALEGALFGLTAMLALPAPAREAGRRDDPTRVVPRGIDDVPPRRARRARAALVGLGALCATLVWQAGPPLDFRNDTLDYAAWADEVAATGRAFPRTAVYADPGDDGRDFRKGLLHGVYGYWCARTGLDAVDLLRVVAALLVALAGAIAYALALRLGARADVAAAAGGLFLLGPSTADALRSLFYPGHFGALPAMTAAAMLARYARTASRCALGAAMALAFTAVAVHVQYAVLTGVAVAAVVAWRPASSRPWREHLRRTIGGGAAMAAAFAPWFAWRFVTGYRANPLHTQVQGAMFVGGERFVVDPARLAAETGVLGLAALLATAAAWRVRERTGAVLLGGVTLVLALLVELDPLAAPAAYALATYLVWRFHVVAPVAVTAAAAPTLRTMGGAHRRLAAAATVLVLVAAVAGAHGLAAGTTAARDGARAGGAMRWRAALTRVGAALPDGSVIASDPMTSYAVTAFTRHRVLCTLGQHASPNDLHAPARTAAARVILGPFSTTSDRVRAARQWGVTHVLVNADVPAGRVVTGWALPAAYAAIARRAFDASAAFRRVVTEGPFVVYALTGTDGESVRVADPPVVAQAPADARRIDRDAGGAHLVAARVRPRVVARGGTVDVDLYWSVRERPEPADRVVSVRLDAIDVPRPPLDRPGSKIVRKIGERLRGRRLRARDDHMIAWGIFGPAAWEPGTVVRDAARVRVPSDLAPGIYVVEARLIRRANRPNHRLRDFLYDDDRYRGVPVDTVRVTP